MSVSQAINVAARKVPSWVVYTLAPLPAVWWFYLGLTGELGPEPIRELERQYGKFALQLLIVGLCVTPLREFFGISLIKFRRAVGLTAFFYVVLHLVVWLVLDMSVLWEQILRDIAKRPYITIGMAAFAVLVPLAITSNNLSIRKLGPMGWRRLHRLTYLAVGLGGAHYLMVVKGWQLEPLIYLVVITALLAMRLKARQGVMTAARILKGREPG